jgi:hypothetical protein
MAPAQPEVTKAISQPTRLPIALPTFCSIQPGPGGSQRLGWLWLVGAALAEP